MGGDVDCLFFAVKRSKSAVNNPQCSYEHQETPSTYRNKFPERERVVSQTLMHRFFVRASSVYLCCIHAWSWATSGNLILLEMEMAENSGAKPQNHCAVASARAALQSSSTRSCSVL